MKIPVHVSFDITLPERDDMSEEYAQELQSLSTRGLAALATLNSDEIQQTKLDASGYADFICILEQWASLMRRAKASSHNRSGEGGGG